MGVSLELLMTAFCCAQLQRLTKNTNVKMNFIITAMA